jgi:hypothetical protein
MLIGMLVTVGLILAPLILVGLLIALTLSLWCWKRVGPYIINFGRWMSDWRNLLPGAVLLFLGYMVAWVLMRLPSFFGTLGVVLLTVLLVVTVVGGLFAFVALTARAVQWFWVVYKRQFWQWVDDILDVAWKRKPAAVAARPARRPPTAAAGTAAEASLPGPGRGARRETPKRHWTSTLWDLLLGKPPQPKRKPLRPTAVRTTDQALGPSATGADRGPSEAGLSAAPVSAAGVADTRAARPSGAPTGTVDRDRSQAVASRAGTGKSMIRIVTFVPRSIYGGLMWGVRKSGEGLEWIRIRLNLE